MRKFLKRVTSLTPTGNRHNAATSPSSPTDPNDDMDNRSERSRASRLKGITNRLFGVVGGSKRAIPSEVSAPTAIRDEESRTNAVDDELSADAFLVAPSNGVERSAAATTDQIEDISKGDPRIPLPEVTASTSLVDESNNVTTVKGASVSAPTALIDAGNIYVDDDQNSITAKKHRCCFLFC